MNTAVSAAAVAAATALPSPSIAATHADAEIIALGAELLRRIPASDQSRKEVERLRVPVERLHRRLVRANPGRLPADLFFMAEETPAGREWRAAFDRYIEVQPWDLACEIQAMEPRTAEGVAYYTIAVAFCMDGGDSDVALMVRAATRAGGVEAPASWKKWLDDAGPWKPSSEVGDGAEGA